MKKNFATNKEVYIVGVRFEHDDSIEPVAVFKTKQAAEQFIDACKSLVQKDKILEIGNGELDTNDVEHLEILQPTFNSEQSFLYFDK